MYVTHSPAETRELGARLARCLRRGDVIALLGNLGAGKSELTRGIARGLGIEGPVPSPTFTILQVYDEARIPLYHFDFYRLSSSDELYEMGLDEWIGGNGIAVIEWPSNCPDVLPPCHLEIRLNAREEEERLIEITPLGGFRTIQLENPSESERGDEAT